MTFAANGWWLGCLALAAVTAEPAAAQQRDSVNSSDLPVGKGTIPLSSIQMQFGTGNLQLVFIPLNESVLRLLAPNTYQSLHALREGKRAQIDSIAQRNGIQEPGVAMVTFQSLAPNTRFDPELLTISLHMQPYRPIGVLPLSASFSNQVLDVRQQAQGLFIFSRALPVTESFTVTYLDGTSDDWANRLQRLDSERARIMGQAHAKSDTSHR